MVERPHTTVLWEIYIYFLLSCIIICLIYHFWNTIIYTITPPTKPTTNTPTLAHVQCIYILKKHVNYIHVIVLLNSSHLPLNKRLEIKKET